MPTFSSIAHHPLAAFALTVALAAASMTLTLRIDNAVQAADSMPAVDLSPLLDE